MQIDIHCNCDVIYSVSCVCVSLLQQQQQLRLSVQAVYESFHGQFLAQLYQLYLLMLLLTSFGTVYETRRKISAI